VLIIFDTFPLILRHYFYVLTSVTDVSTDIALPSMFSSYFLIFFRLQFHMTLSFFKFTFKKTFLCSKQFYFSNIFLTPPLTIWNIFNLLLGKFPVYFKFLSLISFLYIFLLKKFISKICHKCNRSLCGVILFMISRYANKLKTLLTDNKIFLNI
jgi:hypothetical protein